MEEQENEPLYLDIFITDRDLTLDAGKMPTRCANRLSIAQDIKHMLLESGLPTALIGERSPIMRDDIMLQMVLLIEDDERIEAGTVHIQEVDLETLIIYADTVDFGKLKPLELKLSEREF